MAVKAVKGIWIFKSAFNSDIPGVAGAVLLSSILRNSDPCRRE